MSVIEKSRIAVVIYDFEPRGVQRVQIRLANEYASQGYNVDALVYSNAGSLSDTLSESVRVIDLSASSAKSSWWKLIKYFWRERPAAVFSAEDHVNIAVILSLFILPIKIRSSVSCHVSPKLWAKDCKIGSKPWALKKLVKFLYPMSDQCVALSSEMIKEYQDFVGLKPGTMRVIYNPVLDAGKKGATEKSLHEWFSDSDLSVILAVGNLSKIKGFDVLLEAFSLIPNNEEVRLAIVGEGPERDALEELARAYGVSESVFFAGFQPDPERYMRAADVFVLSSRSEGLPTVLIEAIGAGCPVVSTRCGGGALEIMEQGALGPLVEVENPQGLADAIIDVLKAPKNPNRLKDSAKRFSTDIVAKKYIAGVME